MCVCVCVGGGSFKRSIPHPRRNNSPRWPASRTILTIYSLLFKLDSLFQRSNKQAVQERALSWAHEKSPQEYQPPALFVCAVGNTDDRRWLLMRQRLKSIYGSELAVAVAWRPLGEDWCFPARRWWSCSVSMQSLKNSYYRRFRFSSCFVRGSLPLTPPPLSLSLSCFPCISVITPWWKYTSELLPPLPISDLCTFLFLSSTFLPEQQFKPHLYIAGVYDVSV